MFIVENGKNPNSINMTEEYFAPRRMSRKRFVKLTRALNARCGNPIHGRTIGHAKFMPEDHGDYQALWDDMEMAMRGRLCGVGIKRKRK